MDIYYLGRCNYLIGASVADYIDKAIIRNIVYIPRDFISVGFYNYFEFSFRIDNTVCSAIVINFNFVYIGFNIFSPGFLSIVFETCWR
jgi:hypothetical protein